ncbi:hypothetical protein F0562_002052 [Nyssa sinensis]|uniref:Uncharacterized protein n=1 Tax=Nyssa sinensis TaxID=561372 RepID=A0A5J5C4Y3_9ASTE|nr:hypothetical protein F0562_002052 [Nyssa sinensis]
MEKFQNPELVGSTSIGRSQDHDIDFGTDDRVIPSKRKRYKLDVDFDTSATVANKDIRASIVDATSSPSSRCKRHTFVETCAACSKRRRIDFDSPKQELCSCNTTLNKDLSETSILQDRGEPGYQCYQRTC